MKIENKSFYNDKLNKFIKEIKEEFSISEKLAKKLILKTSLSLEDLKKELNNNDKNDKINLVKEKERLNKLYKKLNAIKEELITYTKNNLDELQNDLNLENKVFKDNIITKKIFGDKLLKKVKNPKNIKDDLIGLGIGSFNSIINIGEFAYLLVLGILKTPLDIIKIVKKEVELDSIKKI